MLVTPSFGVTLQDLRVLAADGLITRVFGDAYIAAGSALTPSVRAGAVAAMAEPGDVIGRDTAVWVYTGALATPLLHILVPGGKRHRRFRPDCLVHESRARGDEIITLAGLRLTTVHRSVYDVCAGDLTNVDNLLESIGSALDWADFDDYLVRRGPVPGRARIRAAVQRRLGGGSARIEAPTVPTAVRLR
ncbi:hypothetical protein GCM10027344_14880 [Spelaeicoccus albus]